MTFHKIMHAESQRRDESLMRIWGERNTQVSHLCCTLQHWDLKIILAF